MKWIKKDYKTRKESLDYYIYTPIGEINIYDLSKNVDAKYNFQLIFNGNTISYGDDLDSMMNMGESVLRSIYNELGDILKEE